MVADFHTMFIGVFLLFILYVYYEATDNEVTYVISDIDNHKYLVRNLEDSREAANLLARIKKKLVILCDELKKKYPQKDNVERLINKFNPDNITETGKNSRYTSYSVNKGEKIVLCLRSRDEEEKLVDENTLTFVALHELAHIMTKSIGHTDEFWKNFKFILVNAHNIKAYKPVDYNRHPQKYCGITVTDTPLSDTAI